MEENLIELEFHCFFSIEAAHDTRILFILVTRQYQNSSSLANKINKTNYETITTMSWSSILTETYSINHVLITLPTTCLTPQCSSNTTINEALYHVLSSGQTLKPDLWSLSPNSSTLIILQLGLLDFLTFLSNPSQSTNSHSISTFMTILINTYGGLIKTIRAATTKYDNATGYSSSYMYNSAPARQALFLLPPFHPSAVIQRLMAHVLHQVHHLRRKEGDLRVFAIDTSGWLGSDDFGRSDDVGIVQLVETAHKKVAEYLALHMSAFSSSGLLNCEANKRDVYVGNLIVPEEKDLQRKIEEKRLERVKRVLGM